METRRVSEDVSPSSSLTHRVSSMPDSFANLCTRIKLSLRLCASHFHKIGQTPKAIENRRSTTNALSQVTFFKESWKPDASARTCHLRPRSRIGFPACLTPSPIYAQESNSLCDSARTISIKSVKPQRPLKIVVPRQMH